MMLSKPSNTPVLFLSPGRVTKSGEGLESGDWLERSRAIKLENGAFLTEKDVAGNLGSRDLKKSRVAYVIGWGCGLCNRDGG